MKILNADINNVNYDELINEIISTINFEKRTRICYINFFQLLRKTPYIKSLNSCFNLIHSDGFGIYLTSRFLYGKSGLKEYITGTDLYFRLFEELNKRKGKIFLYGGDEKAKSIMIEKLNKDYPNIILGGYYSRRETFNNNVLKKMNESKSDILFIGLGTPFQEEFVCKYSDKINIPVLICVGSGIDFLSGYLTRAPLLLRKLRLEWVFRVFIEPKRLFVRYFFGIPLFIFKVIVQKFKLLLKC